MEEKEYYGIKVGEFVEPLIGPHRGKRLQVLKIESNCGSQTGWFTCKINDNANGLYAGAELVRISNGND